MTSQQIQHRLHQIDISNENQHKSIQSDLYVQQFQATHAYDEITKYIQQLNQHIIGQKVPATYDTAQYNNIYQLEQMFDAIQNIFMKYVPSMQPVPTIEHTGATVSIRFGHPSYRTALNEFQSHSQQLLDNLLHSCNTQYTDIQLVDLTKYLDNSFGNIQRIDYGTGHELNFMCFLYALTNLQYITTNDAIYTVLVIYYRYIRLIRCIQMDYLLEPAGSRGVWGLDDYCFLPYYFGSAQLINHAHIKPRSIKSSDIIELYQHDYIYLDSISYIMKVKSSSFAEHSPLLNDITIIKSWAQVNTGLYKMYLGEVLHKYTVIQHFIYTGYLTDQQVNELVPIQLHPHELPCCTDTIQFPSSMASKSMNQHTHSVNNT